MHDAGRNIQHNRYSEFAEGFCLHLTVSAPRSKSSLKLRNSIKISSSFLSSYSQNAVLQVVVSLKN
jgi:hypothetical protein